jgi:hypothetical protein
VTLPAVPPNAPGQADLDLLGALVIILHRSSMLPWDTFMAALDKAGRLGLMNRIAAVTSHRTATAYFVDADEPGIGGLRGTPIGDPEEFSPREAAELAARRTPGPGYSQARALDAIQARYEHIAAATRYTLSRTLSDPAAGARLRQLAGEGRPEWIILMALANTVMNHRLLKPGTTPASFSSEQWIALAHKELRREEQPDDPSPSAAEICDALPVQLNLVAANTAQFWGLTLNQETPDFEAIESLLRTRYRYWADDTDHASHLS